MDVDIMFDPERYGYQVCPHCNGYGSSLKDPTGVDKCSLCSGLGLVKKDMDKGDMDKGA